MGWEMYDLEQYLEINRDLYEQVFSKIDDDYFRTVTLRYQYIKFNPTQEPKFDKLIEILSEHITHYCFSVSKRENKSESEKNRLYREARDLFRKLSKTGELGEMILWFLLESVLQAPQVVAKMDLKTNRNDEVKGADGLHVKVNDGILEVFFGEAKLYKDFNSALNRAFGSIKNFYDNKDQIKREYNLITTHFKWLKEGEQQQIYNFISTNIEADEVKIKFACLIGFDWDEYQKLDNPEERDAFIDNFIDIYTAKSEGLKSKIERKFESFQHKHLEIEFFILPFKSVEDMRERFRDGL